MATTRADSCAASRTDPSLAPMDRTESGSGDINYRIVSGNGSHAWSAGKGSRRETPEINCFGNPSHRNRTPAPRDLGFAESVFRDQVGDPCRDGRQRSGTFAGG